MKEEQTGDNFRETLIHRQEETMQGNFKTEVLTLRTTHENQLLDITDSLGQAILRGGMRDGILTVFVPHTTAGITINEAADPDVQTDILLALDKAFPDLPEFRHREGNSRAHVRASLMGSSCQIIVEAGTMQLGSWQGVYLCEFDGPRTRRIFLKFLGE